MASLATLPKTPRKGRGFLKQPVTTTISLEGELHKRVQRAAAGLGQSVSQWIVDAANRKMKLQRRAREGAK